MIRLAFVRLANVYVFLVGFTFVFFALAVLTTVWMTTTYSVAPALLQPLYPVLPASQDPRVEPHIPLNVDAVDAFRKIEVPGWEYEFEQGSQEERLLHTLGILSLHNGGTYRIEPATAPVTFISDLEAAAAEGVVGVEQFLLDAGNRAGWCEAQYSEYETVVIELVPNAKEEYLFKAFYASATLAILMLPVTVVAFRSMRKRSDT